MAEIPESAREFLATGPLGHLVTLNEDGTPHITLTWAGFDGDELEMATFHPEQRKVNNMRRDPRIVVSFQANQYEGPGLHPYLVIQGRARVTEGGALEVMDGLAEHYVGPGQQYPMRDVPEGAVIRIAVDRVYGQEPWGEESEDG
jgi:PPOX class probable F420-dependent enzyme